MIVGNRTWQRRMDRRWSDVDAECFSWKGHEIRLLASSHADTPEGQQTSVICYIYYWLGGGGVGVGVIEEQDAA